MSLRLRLIVAFFLLSIVPLSAVTFYTYTTNARSLQEAASREAAFLAGDLKWRMDVVTARLTERMGHVMDLSPEDGATDSAGSVAAEADVVQALGDMAVLLDNIEVRGQRRAGGRGRRLPPDAPPPGEGLGNGRPPEGRETPAAGQEADASRVRVDLGPRRRALLRELVPDGQWRQLSNQERQRIREIVDQRLLGIVPGPTGRPAGDPANDPTNTAQVVQAARRRAVVSSNHLDVVEESDGQVVHQASVDLNLSNLLGTLFTATARDRGEIPFAIAADGQMYAPSDAERERLTAIGVPSLKPSTPVETTVLDDWMVVALADQAGLGLTFGIARPMGDSFRELRSTTMRNAGIGLGFIALAFLGIVPISSRLTRNLETLTEGARRIAAGDFRARVDVTSRDEVGRLAATFNQMAADVERHEAAAVQQERIRKELELGRRIQHDMLPRGPLRFGLSEITGMSMPAREVGGDFFNYFQLASGEVAILVGDVSGKGVGPALLMANLQASLRSRLALGQDLAALAHQLDVDVEGAGELYATLFVGVFDPATRELRYVNAGHHPQYVLRNGEGVERMTATGLPIGLLAGRPYEERRLTLQPADVLFFYTDGCIEAEDEAGDMLGRERLEAILTSSEGAADVLAHVEAEVKRFRGRCEPNDDTAMMVARIG